MDLDLTNPVLRFVLDNIYTRLYGAAWSFEGFFAAYGFYKAFKVRNVESGVLLACALVLLLTAAPVMESLFGSGLTSVGNWIMDVPNNSAQRGLMIAGGFGIILLGFRTILGKERGYLRGA
jgi:hypothetical protein